MSRCDEKLMKHAQHPCDLQLILSRSRSHTGAAEALNVSWVSVHDPRPGRQQGREQLSCQVHRGNQGSGEKKGPLMFLDEKEDTSKKVNTRILKL